VTELTRFTKAFPPPYTSAHTVLHRQLAFVCNQVVDFQKRSFDAVQSSFAQRLTKERKVLQDALQSIAKQTSQTDALLGAKLTPVLLSIETILGLKEKDDKYGLFLEGLAMQHRQLATKLAEATFQLEAMASMSAQLQNLHQQQQQRPAKNYV